MSGVPQRIDRYFSTDNQQRVSLEHSRESGVNPDITAERVRQRADQAYQWMGMGLPPPPNQGESINIYRQRLLEPLVGFSPKWRALNVSGFREMAANPTMLRNVEDQVIADSIETGKRMLRPGELRCVVEKDETGREIKQFYGDPAACWDEFKMPVKYMTGYKTNF